MRKAYPKYKPSGVAWIGEIPEHWVNSQLKNNCRITSGYAFNSDDYTDEGIPLIRIGDLNSNGKVELRECKQLPQEYEGIYRPFLVNKNDLLMAMTGATIGKLAVYCHDKEALLNQRVCRFDPHSELNISFLKYVLISLPYLEHIKLLAFGGAQPNISETQLLSFSMAFPVEKSEQTKIAIFLDLLTGKLDTLIAKKTEFIERLKEKRTALVSQVVTKGLPPEEAKKHGLPVNPKMKPSGVEWLGEIPEHWSVKKIKHISFLRSGKSITSEEIEDDADFPVYGGNGLRGYYHNYTHQGHFVLIGRQGALCGNINYANGTFWASEHAVVCNPLTQFATLWLGELLRFMNLNQYSEASAQPGLAAEKIKNLRIPVPPLDEQKLISEFLELHLSKIDKLVEKVECAIVGLEEYRSALITAAVTGKIDVREVAA